MIESYKDIAACVTYMGNMERSSFRELRADQDLWDLQAPISAAGDIFGRKPRCAARSRDVADGGGACSRNAFRRFPLVLIAAAKVIRVLGPPLPTRLLFLLRRQSD